VPRLALAAPVPNPARGAVRLRFSLPSSGNFTLTLHDVRGRLIRRLASGPRKAGPGTATWDGRTDDGAAAPAGVYFARLAIDRRIATQALVRLP